MQSFVLTLASNGHIESVLRLISVTVRKRSISVTADGLYFAGRSIDLTRAARQPLFCLALTIREAPMTEPQKQPDPKQAGYRNGMVHRLERIEARRGGHQGRARHQVDATAADGAADGQADRLGDETRTRRTVERPCRAERQRNELQQEASR
jgi:hypothetical protein